jgi:hypothetical protein
LWRVRAAGAKPGGYGVTFTQIAVTVMVQSVLVLLVSRASATQFPAAVW